MLYYMTFWFYFRSCQNLFQNEWSFSLFRNIKNQVDHSWNQQWLEFVFWWLVFPNHDFKPNGIRLKRLIHSQNLEAADPGLGRFKVLQLTLSGN